MDANPGKTQKAQAGPNRRYTRRNGIDTPTKGSITEEDGVGMSQIPQRYLEASTQKDKQGGSPAATKGN